MPPFVMHIFGAEASYIIPRPLAERKGF
jgi:hypothetical protein